MRLLPRMPLACCGVLLSLLAHSNGLGAVTFGEPEQMGAYGGCQGLSTSLEIDSNFYLNVRNCWGEPVRVLLTLTYHTPGGVVSDPDQYGMSEEIAVFGAAADEVRCPIENILGDPNGYMTVASVRATTYHATTGELLDSSASVQLAEDPASLATLSPAQDLAIRAQIKSDLMVRGIHTPDTGGQCAHGEQGWTSVENRGKLKLKGSLLGKVMCSKDVSTPDSCRAGSSLEATESSVVDFILDGEGCKRGASVNLVDDASGEAFFHNCCDPQPPPTNQDNWAVITVQCTEVSISEVEIDGSFYTLSEPVGTGWHRDVEPTVPQPPVVPTDPAKYDLDESDLAPGFCDGFIASSPTRLSSPLACTTLVLDSDVDSDGIFDNCDYVVSSTADQSVDTTVTIIRGFRNRLFTDNGGFSDDVVHFLPENVGGVTVGGVPISTPITVIDDEDPSLNTISFTMPAGKSLGSQTIAVIPTGTAGTVPSDVRDPVVVRDLGFVSVPGSDYLHPFDPVTGGVVDIDPSYENSDIDLPPPGPNVMAFTTEPGNENRELFFGSGTEVFALSLDGFGLLEVGGTGNEGLNLGGAVKDLALPRGRGEPGERVGDYLFVLHGDADIAAIDVRSAQTPRFSSQAAITQSVGFASRLAAVALPNNEFIVYTTFSCIDCVYSLVPGPGCAVGAGGESMMMGGMEALGGITPCPPAGCGGGEPGGGGGSGGSSTVRITGISIRQLAATANPDGTTGWSVTCSGDVLLENFGGGVGEVLPQNPPPLDSLGMDFNTAGTELFIVSPDADSLLILDAINNQLVLEATGQPVQIVLPVGAEPVDLEILNVFVDDGFGAFVLRDRAYVANSGDDTMSIIDVDPLVRAPIGPPRVLANDFAGLTNLNIQTVVGSVGAKGLFLVSPGQQRVLSYRLDSPDSDNPIPGLPFSVGPSPHSVALQE